MRTFTNLFFSKRPPIFWFDGQGDPGGATPPTTPPPAPAPKTVTYTQEQLDAMFADRAGQGGRAALNELFKALGVKDVDELKASYTEGKKLLDGQKTDLDKANADKKAADDLLVAEKSAHEATRNSFLERLLKAEVKAEAKKAGFRDEALDDVWMLAKNSENRAKITEKDDAFVGVDKVVEEIKKAKPFWLLGEDPKKPRTPGSPRLPRKPGDGQPETNTKRKGPFKSL